MIHVETTVNADAQKVWNYFTDPAHIINWYFASDDWHAPKAENDLQVHGKFKTNMAAKDGSFAFDFEGSYTKVEPITGIEYKIIDGRKVIITFSVSGDEVTVKESFEAENQNSEELQQQGWQAILNNFKKYVEAN